MLSFLFANDDDGDDDNLTIARCWLDESTSSWLVSLQLDDERLLDDDAEAAFVLAIMLSLIGRGRMIVGVEVVVEENEEGEEEEEVVEVGEEVVEEEEEEERLELDRDVVMVVLGLVGIELGRVVKR